MEVTFERREKKLPLIEGSCGRRTQSFPNTGLAGPGEGGLGATQSPRMKGLQLRGIEGWPSQ